MKVRVAIIQPTMAPYRFACFSALAARPDIELLVIYLRRGSQPYDWAADERMARFERIDLEATNRGDQPGAGLIGSLRHFRPDVTIVGGWDKPSYFLVTALRPFLGKRVAVWAESTPHDWRRRTLVKDLLKRTIMRRADAVVVPGSAARAYCEGLGVSVRRWYVAPNAVDNDRFAAGARAAREQGLRPFQAPRPVFLYVGRLDREKGLEVLLKSWGKIETVVEGSLIIAGAGRQELALKRFAEEIGVTRVQFVGFISQADLPAWYGSADVFVFPSLSDPWGLVINEAMACGLPIITTSAPGAAADLVDGVNGRVVSPGDEVALAGAMSEVAADISLRNAMGGASIRRIAAFSPNVWATAIAQMAIEIR